MMQKIDAGAMKKRLLVMAVVMCLPMILFIMLWSAGLAIFQGAAFAWGMLMLVAVAYLVHSASRLLAVMGPAKSAAVGAVDVKNSGSMRARERTVLQMRGMCGVVSAVAIAIGIMSFGCPAFKGDTQRGQGSDESW
jgi:hypothetical protein